MLIFVDSFILEEVFCSKIVKKIIMPLVGVNFEVFGIVQGVFFRKHTLERAVQLGLNGHCKNTRNGTVLGYIEGEKAKVEEMKNWLGHTGSPKSRIDKVDFKDEKELEAPTMKEFSIIREKR